MQRVLVTGADGFIGRKVVSVLREQKITVCGLRSFQGVDIRNRQLVSQIVANERPDSIIHLAAISGPMLLRDNPAEVTEVNTVGTVNIYDAARQAGVRRVVYASSVAVLEKHAEYGTTPLSVYGATKQFGETVATLYWNNHGLESVSARIGSVYGSERQTEHVLNDMISEADRTGIVPYDSRAVEPLIEVRDVARLLASLVSVGRPRNIYDLVTTVTAHRELALIVAEIMGCRAAAVPVDGSNSTWSQPFDTRTVFEDTGERVTVPTMDGIADLVKGIRVKGQLAAPRL